MSKMFNNKISKAAAFTAKLGGLVFAAALATGCVGAKGNFSVGATGSKAAPSVASPETSASGSAADSANVWNVSTGDNLWNIAGEQTVYQTPEQWPLIYKQNIDQIKDADLIYPGQVLDIPRDSSAREINAAVEHARNRGAWAVGTSELSDQEYLQSNQ